MRRLINRIDRRHGSGRPSAGSWVQYGLGRENENLPAFVEQMAAYSAKQVAVFMPTAGSFGEIFSFMWETLLQTDLLEHSAQVENFINELPTVWQAARLARRQ